MKRALEISTALAAILIVGGLAWANPAPSWLVVGAFGAMIVLAENFDIPQIHGGNVSITPGSMLMMAAIAVLSERSSSSAIVGGALVAAFSGLYLPHIRARDLGIVAFNCSQYALSACAAAVVYTSAAGSGGFVQLAAAAGAAAAFGVVNIGLVLPYVAMKQGERIRVVWADMYPAIPNYLAWGLLGLLVGLVCAELGALAIVLLALPMGIGRWTFRSFNRVREAHDASVQLFIRLIEAKDPYTAGHTERVAKYSLYVGEELDLPANRLEHLRQSALMHDVGKLAVPSRLLNKPGKLTPEEFAEMQKHPVHGAQILGNIQSATVKAVLPGVQYHHEKWDGTGYPEGLKAEAIPFLGRLLGVADFYDALTSARAYRGAMPANEAIKLIQDGSGKHFDPAVAAAMLRLFDRGELHVDAMPSEILKVLPARPPE